MTNHFLNVPDVIQGSRNDRLLSPGDLGPETQSIEHAPLVYPIDSPKPGSLYLESRHGSVHASPQESGEPRSKAGTGMGVGLPFLEARRHSNKPAFGSRHQTNVKARKDFIAMQRDYTSAQMTSPRADGGKGQSRNHNKVGASDRRFGSLPRDASKQTLQPAAHAARSPHSLQRAQAQHPSTHTLGVDPQYTPAGYLMHNDSHSILPEM